MDGGASASMRAARSFSELLDSGPIYEPEIRIALPS
jgi:hypothetical protein